MRLLPWRRRVMDLAVTGEPEQCEAEVSRERQRRTREQVIRPLRELEEHNQFAAIIRASLTEGRGRRA